METFEEQVRELEAYPELRGLKITISKYVDLYQRFEKSLEKGELDKYVYILVKELELQLANR